MLGAEHESILSLPLYTEEYCPWRDSETYDVMSVNFKDAKENILQKYSLQNSSEQHAKFTKLQDRKEARKAGEILPPRTGSFLGIFLSLHLKNDCDGICSLSSLPAEVSGTENSLVTPTFPGIC